VKPKALLSWSSGKDCAWALHLLRQRCEVEVVGLVTTFNETFQRVAMHGVRMERVQAQAKAACLPLWAIPLPWPCTNEVYEERMRAVVERARSEGIRAFAFGDLHLADIRAYRKRQLAGTDLEPLFPVWGTPADTPHLARAMIASGLGATLTCVDPKQLAPEFVGCEFDHSLLADLPPAVDPCGENGEFHTFCHTGPMFDCPIPVSVGNRIERDGFWFADLIPGEGRESIGSLRTPLVEGLDYYIENGRWVFTAAYHQKRGHCCENVCRHCPFGNSPTDRAKATAAHPESDPAG
jgi:diphthamide synthase (EF-2-diphthine--ammonia ligase)